METLNTILANIEAAKKQSPLAADAPVLLGASKGQPAAVIQDFIKAGLTHFGENRVQETESKWPALKAKYPHVQLHLIGPLQTNKVEDALAVFDVIQTLDRPKLADAVARCQASGVRCQAKEFYIQINIGEEPQKAGVSPQEASGFIRYCRELKLNVVGLMCVPPASGMPAPHFALLKKIAHENGLGQLSMGMSGDYETAIRMGSTCVRVGTALFGARI